MFPGSVTFIPILDPVQTPLSHVLLKIAGLYFDLMWSESMGNVAPSLEIREGTHPLLLTSLLSDTSGWLYRS